MTRRNFEFIQSCFKITITLEGRGMEGGRQSGFSNSDLCNIDPILDSQGVWGRCYCLWLYHLDISTVNAVWHTVSCIEAPDRLYKINTIKGGAFTDSILPSIRDLKMSRRALLPSTWRNSTKMLVVGPPQMSIYFMHDDLPHSLSSPC